MLPGNPQILTCPYCGQTKNIMSLLSGNTFGAQLWSDNKQIAPMLPEISYKNVRIARNKGLSNILQYVTGALCVYIASLLNPAVSDWRA